MGIKHGGCAACGSKDEPILTSGVGIPGGNLKGADSFAVCSRPDCRAQVRMVSR